MNSEPFGPLRRLTCMRRRRLRSGRIAAVSCVVGAVLSVPAFAQSDSPERQGDTPRIVALALDRTSMDAMRAYVPALVPAPQRTPTLPAVLNPGKYRQRVEDMLRRSPTFRRQCQRLATPRLSRVILSSAMLHGPRAVTQVLTTADGPLYAVVQLAPLDDDVELIAHEIEHIIEQLDGVDLRSRASLPATGVYTCHSDRNTFETTRAIRVGLKVAEEFRRGGG